jgi:hypothetical protein
MELSGLDNQKPFCNTHDGDPYMTEEEQEEWESGGDPCQLYLK